MTATHHTTATDHGTFYWDDDKQKWVGELPVTLDSGKTSRRYVSGTDQNRTWRRFRQLVRKHVDTPAVPDTEYRYTGRTNSYPVPPPPDPGWDAQAACQGQPVDMFFEQDVRVQRYVIQTYCQPCPVRQECLQEALAADQQIWRAGIWGGTTINERRRMLRAARDTTTTQEG